MSLKKVLGTLWVCCNIFRAFDLNDLNGLKHKQLRKKASF